MEESQAYGNMNNWLPYNYNGNAHMVICDNENVIMLPHRVKTNPNYDNVFEKSDYVVYRLNILIIF
jgi:hypothetical protein